MVSDEDELLNTEWHDKEKHNGKTKNKDNDY